MTTFTTFTKRIAYRLTAINSNNCKVRTKAQQIKNIIDDEMINCDKEGFNNGALHFLAYSQGKIPKTTTKQKEWLKKTIIKLDDIKEQK